MDYLAGERWVNISLYLFHWATHYDSPMVPTLSITKMTKVLLFIFKREKKTHKMHSTTLRQKKEENMWANMPTQYRVTKTIQFYSCRQYKNSNNNIHLPFKYKVTNRFYYIVLVGMISQKETTIIWIVCVCACVLCVRMY